MIESTCPTNFNRLINLQDKAVRYIDNDLHKSLKCEELCDLYGIQPLNLRWREHISSLMYRQSKMGHKVDASRAYINLRSNKKVKFKKKRRRKYEIYLKSPLS